MIDDEHQTRLAAILPTTQTLAITKKEYSPTEPLLIRDTDKVKMERDEGIELSRKIWMKPKLNIANKTNMTKKMRTNREHQSGKVEVERLRDNSNFHK